MKTWHQSLSLLLVLAGALGGCVTPSVPIPPPSPDKVVFALDADNGSATFSFDADTSYANAVVYVFNRDVGEGIITSAAADGSVSQTPPFPALEGDEIVITFELETQISSTCVTIRDGRSNSGLECEQ